MPKKKSRIIAATVGITHLRSLGLRAGRKKPITSQTMTGVQMMRLKKKATLKRIVKPPSTLRTVSSFDSNTSLIGSSMMSMRVGVAT